jgi:putative Ca2+/H+ antiporter (TMEM165/GDT1 family)
MVDQAAAALLAIAATLFVAELTDKDALLLLALATRIRPTKVFLAGSLAFFFTTAVIVSFGSLLIAVVPLLWIRIAGGTVMLGYGAFLAARIAKNGSAGDAGDRGPSADAGGRGILAMAGSLALLDLAGDATEVLIVVFLARYADPLLVFSGACAGLIAATAFETALGNTLGRVLTKRRLLYLSAAVFLVLGAYVVGSSL